MDAVRLEVVTSAPVEDIVRLYVAGGWWEEKPGEREGIPALIRGSFRFLLAVDADAGIVGMGRALSDGVSDAYIQDVIVVPEFRGRGIGARIVQRLVAECERAGIGWIGLIAEPGTEPFYEKLGFAALPGYLPMRRGQAASP